MSSEDPKCRAPRATLYSLMTLMIASLPARASEQEASIALTADDARLQWGPCPAFLPEGCRIAVLHGDPAKPNADLFFKVPPNSALPLHWHNSPERMVLVAGELRVTYEGQAETTLKPGTYAYGPARRPHKGFCASAAPCVLFIAFESPVDAMSGKGGS